MAFEASKISARYLVVEGPIGVGKTSLAEALADRLKGRRLLENPEGNPFLPLFYKDRWRYAFQTQLYFLLNRFRQQQELLQFELFTQSVVSDYLFAKDRIFAILNLDEQELGLYERLHPILEAQVPKPDLVLYLQASTDVLLERIALRGRSYEKEIERGYLEEVNAAYSHFFLHYQESPLLIVNTNELDFVKNQEDFEELLKRIAEVKAGTHYYVPLGSRG
ncbi:MAG: deoxynucleoside kinase [candidate division NC10 bacterium]|nr:deoxynucleoside kinase [candidate division NC10 bacterium]